MSDTLIFVVGFAVGGVALASTFLVLIAGDHPQERDPGTLTKS